MKLTRHSLAPAIVLGLCVGLAGACGSKKPPGTKPPGETGGSGGGGSDAGSDGGGDVSDGGDGGSASDGGSGDGGSGAPTSCDAKVADTPTLLFSGQVIIRPPVGVTFPEGDDNPMVQQAIMSGGFMSACDALIKRMLVTAYERDKKKKPAKLMDEFIKSLESQGYAGGTKSSTYVDEAADYHLSVEYPGGSGGEATVLYLAIARRGDKDFVVVLETSPDELKLLKPTFEESAKSLYPVPQD